MGEVVISQPTSIGKGCFRRRIEVDELAAELRMSSDICHSFSCFLGAGGQNREVSFVLCEGSSQLMVVAVVVGAGCGLPRSAFRPGTPHRHMLLPALIYALLQRIALG